MKIYVASSWRNELQAFVVHSLRSLSHEVYDFKHPHLSKGFHWSEIDTEWRDWTIADYRSALLNFRAEEGFSADHKAMVWADACVLVLPCGRSAHLEAGWFAGKNKPTVVYTQDNQVEPELMYKEFGYPYILNTLFELFDWAENIQKLIHSPYSRKTFDIDPYGRRGNQDELP